MATAAPEIPLLPRDREFENLYRQYVKDVYHYALALLRNPADAEDVTQTTFLNAYRAFQRGEEVQKPHNWLIKIAHNAARSRYARTSRRVKEVPLDDHADQLAMPEEERTNVEGVLRALGRLPFNQRAALVMRELEGRSYLEIADTLGVSVPAVETLIFRARRSLRVRTAALRSILAVPVPTSLAQLFEGGVAAVGGGIGAGFVVKAAIALIAGAVATGVSSDRGSRAVAAPDAAPQTSHVATSTKQHSPTRTKAATKRTAKAQRVAGHASRSGVTENASTETAATHVASVVVDRPAGSGSSSPAPAPSPVETVSTTATSVVGTVEETASTVTSAVPQVPVSIPPLPVQPPILPKLP